MRWSLISFLSFFLAGFSHAQSPVQQAAYDLERHFRPAGETGPTQVIINAFVIDVIKIDDVEGTITMDYFLTQRWLDPRLADDEFADPRTKLNLQLEDIWNPHLVSVDMQDSNMTDTLLNIDPAGNVTYRQRGISTFTATLKLREFPFDTQLIELVFLSSLYTSDDIELIYDMERSGHLEGFSLSGWQFQNFFAETTVQPITVAKNQTFNLTGIQFVIELKRKPAFYIWKVFFPLGLIAFMAWTVFWIDPANFGGQVAISTASVITLIAFQLSLSELLPRISYLTKIDLYAVGTSLLVFIALGESILTARLAKMEKHQLSLFIDRHMRWIYPTVYVLLTLIVII
jgi:hypothetical protein